MDAALAYLLGLGFGIIIGYLIALVVAQIKGDEK
jgi:hypothetical protein